jgi:hypothetical protein
VHASYASPPGYKELLKIGYEECPNCHRSAVHSPEAMGSDRPAQRAAAARTRTNVQASDEAILRNALPKPGIDPGYLGDPPGDKSPIRGATFAMRRIQHEVYR